MNEIYRQRITKIAQLIPADSFIVHTHGDREAVSSWAQAVGDRGLMHWLNVRGLGFARAKTFYFEGREDLFQYPASGNRLEILGAVEYMWNVNAPGSTEVRRDQDNPYMLVGMGDEGDTPADVGKQVAQYAKELVDGVPYCDWLLQRNKGNKGRQQGASHLLIRQVPRTGGGTATEWLAPAIGPTIPTIVAANNLGGPLPEGFAFDPPRRGGEGCFHDSASPRTLPGQRGTTTRGPTRGQPPSDQAGATRGQPPSDQAGAPNGWRHGNRVAGPDHADHALSKI